MLRRARLHDALEQEIAVRRLVVLRAPLGFGKTTLVKHVLAGHPVATIWYDAQPWDADAFVPPLVDAVRRQREDFGRRTLDFVAEGAAPDRVAVAFAADLSHVREPITIVIDDAHLLAKERFGPFVDRLIVAVPEATTLIVLSRSAVPFALASAVAKGVALSLGETELAFDDDEAVELGAAHGVAASDARTLNRRLSGWPAGVHLIMRSGRDDGIARAYVAEALLDRMDPRDVAIVQRCAPFETLDGEVIDALGSAYRKELRRLADDGSFVSVRDDTNGFQVHPALRATVLERMRADDPQAVRRADVEAARLYASIGRIAPALFHLERADDVDAMLALKEHAVSALINGDVDRVATFAARARAAGANDPALFAFIAAYRSKTYGFEHVRDAFVAAMDVADRTHDERLAFECRVQLVEHDLAGWNRIEPDRIADILDRGARLGPAHRASAAVRAGWNEVIEGRFASALAYADDAPITRSLIEASLVAPLRIYAKTALGLFSQAEAETDDVLRRLESSSPKLTGRMLIWAARFAALRGETTAAFEYAVAARRLCEGYEMRTETPALLLILAEAAIHVGRPEAALEAVRLAEAGADAAWYARDAERMRDVARWLRTRARCQRSADAAQALRDARSDGGIVSQRVVRAAVLADGAWYALLAGDARESESLAERARREIERAAPVDAYDVVVLADASERIASLTGARGDERAAPSFDRAGFGAMLVRRALARGPRFETWLADQLAPAATPPHGVASAVESLTAREREILGLLVDGLTNKEIAQRLVVSPRTAETHVASVFGKLGVNSRARAIAKALADGYVVRT